MSFDYSKVLTGKIRFEKNFVFMDSSPNGRDRLTVAIPFEAILMMAQEIIKKQKEEKESLK